MGPKTVICNYGATGEGSSLMVWIGYASDAESALRSFGHAFDPYFAQGADVYEGIRTDLKEIAHLFGAETNKAIQEYAGTRCNWHFTASTHINCS